METEIIQPTITTPNHLPEGWSKVKISEIANVVRGSSPRPAGDPRFFKGNYIPWLTVASLTNISDSRPYVSKTETYLTEEGSKQSRILEAGTLILANSGATLGVPKILSIECCANDGVAAFLRLRPTISKEFLYYILQEQTDYFRKVIATGNGQPNLNTELIGSFTIPLPPLAEQQRIATILMKWDEGIEKLKTLISRKKDRKQALMQQLLTGQRRFNEFDGQAWETVKLGSLVIKVGSGITPKGGSKVYGKSGIPLVRSQNVHWGKLVLDDVAYITEEQHQKMRSTWLQPLDVLLNITGASIGRSCVVPSDFLEGNVNQHVCIIRVDNLKLVSQFLDGYLQSALGQAQIDSFQAGGNRQGLNFEQVRSFTIPLPPLAEQRRIAAVLSAADREIEGLTRELALLKEQKRGLMQGLLTGHISVKAQAAAITNN